MTKSHSPSLGEISSRKSGVHTPEFRDPPPEYHGSCMRCQRALNEVHQRVPHLWFTADGKTDVFKDFSRGNSRGHKRYVPAHVCGACLESLRRSYMTDFASVERELRLIFLTAVPHCVEWLRTVNADVAQSLESRLLSRVRGS